MRCSIAPSICRTISTVEALRSGGKALRTKTWPRASPRSRSTQPTQQLPARLLLLDAAEVPLKKAKFSFTNGDER
jgi:hypothetical protein